MNGDRFGDVARIDHDRAQRCGFPEVVLCEGKTPADAAGIAREIALRAGRVLCTRAGPAHVEAIRVQLPAAVHHERARCVSFEATALPRCGRLAIVAAGTADLPVAEEALVTARAMGSRAELIADVGVAGLHRLLAHRRRLRDARVVVVVAGLEGALASVVGGLVDRPLIAVPTSVGYGAHFHGLAPLLAMLNSCAAGVTVVNVDNGFGAGYAAHLINRGARA